jgi:hypothetical protein
LPLVMDEFAGADQVNQFRAGVPYRDFMPYKTVLGYYAQLPVLTLVADPWLAMLLVKGQMAVFTATGVALAAIRLRRLFGAEQVLLGVALLFANSTFIERSAELRVDMLTALVGLASLVLLLERKVVTAGVLAGVSVLVSQKGAFYVLSGALVLVIQWAGQMRNRPALLDGLRWGAAATVPLVVYAVVFGAFADFERVFGKVAVSPAPIAFQDIYDIRRYWQQTLERNPTFYALGALALGALGWRRARHGASWAFDVLAIYALTLTALCAWHKQPWPYFFVLYLPTLAVLLMAGLSVLTDRLMAMGELVRPAIWSGVALLVLLGVIWPLAARVPVVLARDSSVQRQTLAAARSLLGERDVYFAGTQLLWTHRHVPGMTWLDVRRLAAVEANPALALDGLSQFPPKVVIHTHRFEKLPDVARQWFAVDYLHVGGNLFVYSAELTTDAEMIDLRFAGRYRLAEPAPDSAPVIDGVPLAAGELRELSAGPHTVRSTVPARIVLGSDAPAYESNLGQPLRPFFYDVYGY